MKDEFPVAVVIPAYNAAKYLAECLESVLSQTVLPCEIVCVDDGSTDETSAIVSQYKDVHLLTCEHRGVSASRNAGVSATRSKFVSFLDADDLWLPHKIDSERKALTSRVELLHGRVDEFTSDLTNFTEVRPPASYSTAIPSSITVSRDLLERVGPFDETVFDVEFIEWWSRLLSKNPVIESIDDVLVRRRIHQNNKSRQSFNAGAEFLSVIRRNRERMDGKR